MKKEIAQNLENFNRIIFIYSPPQQYLKELGPALLLNLQTIYNKNQVVLCSSFEEAMKYIQSQYKNSNKYLIIITINFLQNFTNFMKSDSQFLKGVYEKCVIFDRNKHVSHAYIEDTVHQIYNISLLTRKMDEKLSKQPQSERSIKFHIEQFYEVKQEMQRQEQYKNIEECYIRDIHQLFSRLQRQDFDPNQLIRKYQIIWVSDYDSPLKQSSLKHLMIMKTCDAQSYINSSETNFVIASSQFLHSYEMIVNCQKIIKWIKCLWGKQYGSSEGEHLLGSSHQDYIFQHAQSEQELEKLLLEYDY